MSRSRIAPNLPAIAVEDCFSIFLVNVNDNGTHVGRAECSDEYLRTEGRAVLTDSMGSENSRVEAEWLSGVAIAAIGLGVFVSSLLSGNRASSGNPGGRAGFIWSHSPTQKVCLLK